MILKTKTFWLGKYVLQYIEQIRLQKTLPNDSRLLITNSLRNTTDQIADKFPLKTL